MKKIYNHKDMISLTISTFDVELLLKSLELYNFNLNICWCRHVNKEETKRRNDIIFYLYHSLLDVYNREYEADYRIKVSKHKNFDISA